MDKLPETRHTLLTRLKEREPGAWEEFLQVYEAAIRNHALRKGLQQADAEDVTQEVLAATSEKVLSWKLDPKKGKFRGWLSRVVRNLAVTQIRNRTRRLSLVRNATDHDQVEQVAEAAESESEAFSLEYRRQLFRWAARKVRPEVRKESWRAFQETAIAGRNASDVATELKISVGAVYAARCRITARIGEIVKQNDDQGLEDRLMAQFHRERSEATAESTNSDQGRN